MQSASPALIGTYQRSDGLPPAPIRIVASTSSGCAHPRAAAVTDSIGRFALPATTVRHHWFLIFPPIERFSNPYWLCIGDNDSTLKPIYNGQGPIRVHDGTPPDTISCVEYYDYMSY
jgi:hypothetical protein